MPWGLSNARRLLPTWRGSLAGRGRAILLEPVSRSATMSIRIVALLAITALAAANDPAGSWLSYARW